MKNNLSIQKNEYDGFYSIKKVAECNSVYTVVFGEKSNGKSYSIKNEILIHDYIENGGKFVIIRRTKEEMKKGDTDRYFDDVVIPECVQDKCDKIVFRSNNIYFAKYNAKRELKVTEHIGYAIPLSVEQNYSSQVFNTVTNIVFEEFVSRGAYLYDEINSKFMYLVSTIARRRKNVRVWLLGNSISRLCPYFPYFEIDIRKMKQGTIETYTLEKNIRGKKQLIDVSVEYTAHSTQENESIAFGNNSDTINSGAWQAEKQQTLYYNYKNDDLIYRIILMFEDDFNYIAEYRFHLQTQANYWFVYPKTKPLFLKNIHVITQQHFSEPHYLVSNVLEPLTKFEQLYFKDFIEEKLYFSNDLCGEEFKRFLPKLRRRYI